MASLDNPKFRRGGVYHRKVDGVNYYYGGGEELGYGNRPRKIHYQFQYSIMMMSMKPAIIIDIDNYSPFL